MTPAPTAPVLAWHFLPTDRRLRYGDDRIVAAGETYSIPDVDRALSLCEYGMHASMCPVDALSYAPGPIVCRVEMSGSIIVGDDKICSEHRKVMWMADATETLRSYARWCARRVTHLWDCPAIVLQYLETGDESIRAAAWAAARATAQAASWAARATAQAASWAARATAQAASWAAQAASWAARDAVWADEHRAQITHLTSLLEALA